MTIDAAGGVSALSRDRLPDGGPARFAHLEHVHDDGVCAALTTLTRSDRALARLVALAAAAVTAARATGAGTVSVLAAGPRPGDPVMAISVPVPAGDTFAVRLVALRTAMLEAAPGPATADFAVSVDGEMTSDAAANAGAVALFEVGTGDTARVRLTYRCDLLTEDTGRRLLDGFAAASAAAALDVQTTIGAVLAATPEELMVVAAANDTATSFPGDAVLHGYLRAAAERSPGSPAVLDDGLTYGELDRRADQLAHRLVGCGVGRGDVVGVSVPRSAGFIVAVHAVLRAGAAYLPLDPAAPVARRETMLRQASARAVVTGATGTGPAPAGVVEVPLDDESIWTGPATAPAVTVGPDDLCYVIFTSGSTGRPKGVGVSHRAVVNRLNWMQRMFPLTGDDVILHKTSTSFDVSVWELFWWSIAGAAVVTLPEGDERDPARIAARIAADRVTVTHFVPSMLGAFTGYLESAGGGDSLGSLRWVFASGESLTARQVAGFRDTVAAGGDARLVNLYGPTEAAIDVTVQDTTDLRLDRPIPIGRPIDNIQLYVLDPTGAPAPLGAPGELHIGGVGLARGYLGDPALTAAAFVPHPFGAGERLYRTGDLARWTGDGTLEFLGRIDHQVKLRGYRIELGEIEHVAAQVPGVGQAAAVVLGESDAARLCLYLAAEASVVGAVRAKLLATLPAYMVPASIVAVPAIPTGRNGKRDPSALPRPAAEAVWEAPRDDRERLLAEIWQAALGVEKVSIRDNFFTLGGDSIRFISVLAALRSAGLDLSFQQLFAHPTIAELAGLLQVSAAAEPVAVPYRLVSDADRAQLPPGVEDAYPLSVLQAGILYECAAGDDDLYHDVATFRVAGELDPDRFTAAVDALVARHPMLRTSLHPSGYSQPLQLVHRAIARPLTIVDLRDARADVADRSVAGLAAAELARPIVLERPGPLRIIVHRCDGEYFVHLSYHAAALDGWSVSTLVRDLFAAYAGAGTQAPGGPGYDRFIELEQADERDPSHRDFWSGLLAGGAPSQLPRLVADPEAPSLVMHQAVVPGALSDAVVRLAGDLRVPVKSVLLAAHAAVLSFVTGEDDVLTGYEHSGRVEEHGGESVAGLFLNTVPFRVTADGAWRDLVQAVYAAESRLLPYRRYPMARMLRDQNRREPLFETVFNFTHFHVLRELRDTWGIEPRRTAIFSRTGYPFRAEFWQDAVADDVGFALHYDGQQFTAGQIERYAGYYLRALELMTAAPEAGIRSMTLVSAAEQRFLAGARSGPRVPLGDETAVDLIARWIRERPGEVAVSCGPASLTYAQLDRRVDQVQALLAGAGVSAGDVVAVPMRRGLDWAVSVLAVLRRGAVYLPMDPDDPIERLRGMLDRAGGRHVLTTAGLGQALTGLGAQCLFVEDAPVDVRVAARPVRPDDIAYIIFTSGSTGRPKGAVVNHRGMLNHLRSKVEDLGLTGRDRIAQLAPACFDISVWQLLAAWLVGGRTVIYPDDAVRDLGAFADGLSADAVTVAETVPSYLDALLEAAAPAGWPDLRYMVVTGEALPVQLVSDWFSRYEIPLVNAYGPTEASDDVTHHVVHGPVRGDRVPVGRPIRNTAIHVVGPDGRPMPTGSFGEVCVTGAGVGYGYINDPARTAAVFGPNPYDDLSPVLYRTGDIGRYLPDGTIDVAGRDDHQVKIRGYRIELTEVESVLAAQPGVANPVVIVARKGDQPRLVAFHTGPAGDDDPGVMAGLAARLPHYMVPDRLVALPALPLTANGKIDRATLTLRAPAPARVAHEPAATAYEAEVIALFAEVLGLPADQVGATDSFFDLGGHSLAAMRVAARLGGLGHVAELIRHPDARSLCRRLARPHESALLAEVPGVSGDSGTGRHALVYVPFAAGGVVTAVLLARAARARPDPVPTYAVDLPARAAGDEQTHPGVAALADRLAAELCATAADRITIVGHSAGTALALATALALQRLGRPVRHLMLVGKVLGEADRTGAVDDMVGLGDTDAVGWLVRNTGFAWAEHLSAADRRDLATALRADVVSARAYLATVLRDPAAHRLTAPTTVVLASDDPVTAGREAAAADWAELAADLRTAVLEDGGHYLQSTRPEALVELALAQFEGK
ncbi:non-ribosomal peptide synthetase [Pseudosporangium ferrugineum]|uniref:Amino acid adenylation domain-containing protein n=1 Tax=Pseudosporangium ferrugineum TaxID=439699 RepID=A0A2T0RFE0_9ACTN|nr:non-ribosomal peptide synthetase [Pseudosporangium ferrugineum]PRY19888.1 amino acid adenylation domain-containing protein [Pseudosporangium ferrugineum]